jgi:hypothetical protein
MANEETPNVETTPNRGCLRHGNPGGDPSKSPRCGAKRRNGQPCRAPAMLSKSTGRYTKCRIHGGASTGPVTVEGKQRNAAAATKHGRYTRAALADRAARRAQLKSLERHVKAHDDGARDSPQ